MNPHPCRLSLPPIFTRAKNLSVEILGLTTPLNTWQSTLDPSRSTTSNLSMFQGILCDLSGIRNKTMWKPCENDEKDVKRMKGNSNCNCLKMDGVWWKYCHFDILSAKLAFWPKGHGQEFQTWHLKHPPQCFFTNGSQPKDDWSPAEILFAPWEMGQYTGPAT